MKYEVTVSIKDVVTVYATSEEEAEEKALDLVNEEYPLADGISSVTVDNIIER